MAVTILQILGAFYLMCNVARYVSEDENNSSDQCFVGKYGLVSVLLFSFFFTSFLFWICHYLNVFLLSGKLKPSLFPLHIHIALL